MKKIVLSVGSDRFIIYNQEKEISTVKVRTELSKLINDCKERNLYVLLESEGTNCTAVDPNEIVWFEITDTNIIDNLKFKIKNLF